MLQGKIGTVNLNLTAMDIQIVFAQVSDTFQGEHAQNKSRRLKDGRRLQKKRVEKRRTKGGKDQSQMPAPQTS